MGTLYEVNGQRKYLTADEREQFLKAAEAADREVCTFCGVLAYTGCRISEALALTVDRIDLEESVIIFESLKKRKKGVYRAVPVPPALVDALDLIHGIRKAQTRKDKGAGVPLWTFARNTAWRKVKAVMDKAGLAGSACATPKGLRHAFGVAAVSKGIPLNLAQRWLGHAQISTTAIYADTVCEEEKSIASRMW